MDKEEKYYDMRDIMRFLSIDWEFERKANKKFPFNNKLEDIKFMWGYVVIPRYGIEKIVQNKISDEEYRDILDKITMLVNIPFVCKERIGVITVNVSLSFRYDKTYKYGDINKSIAEVCYAIEKYGQKTNDFYIITGDTYFQEFMSYFVINNQWGIGATKVISSPEIRLDSNFREIKEDEI